MWIHNMRVGRKGGTFFFFGQAGVTICLLQWKGYNFGKITGPLQRVLDGGAAGDQVLKREGISVFHVVAYYEIILD